MKKIVALVLALVMVMGLATVASAAGVSKSTTNVDVEGWKVVDLTTGDAYEFDEDAEMTKWVYSNVTETVNDETTVYYGATFYGPVADIVETTAFDDGYFVVVAKDYANVQIETGKAVVYARYLDPIADAAVIADLDGYAYTDIVVEAFIDEADDTTKCGAALADYAVVDGDFYAAEGTTLAVYKNEMVLIGDTEIPAYAAFVGHAFFGDSAGDAACKWNVKDNKLTSVKCLCGETFEVVQKIAGLASGTYAPVDMTVEGESNWVVLAPTASAPAAGEKVESAQTFDAGIAMYVGMSVMAAAGSAVVLKKKD
ncbi:MAG: hypothetical protein IKV99_04540 [Oscillospiraceae bacterium]|nr:hypothetical protein [Oscillospiraceae bacterium]